MLFITLSLVCRLAPFAITSAFSSCSPLSFFLWAKQPGVRQRCRVFLANSGQWAFPAMWSLAPPHHLAKSLTLSIRAIQLQWCRQSRGSTENGADAEMAYFFFFVTALLERRQVTVHTSYVRSSILGHFGQQAFKSWCFFVFVIKEFRFPKCCGARC